MLLGNDGPGAKADHHYQDPYACSAEEIHNVLTFKSGPAVRLIGRAIIVLSPSVAAIRHGSALRFRLEIGAVRVVGIERGRRRPPGAGENGDGSACGARRARPERSEGDVLKTGRQSGIKIQAAMRKLAPVRWHRSARHHSPASPSCESLAMRMAMVSRAWCGRRGP